MNYGIEAFKLDLEALSYTDLITKKGNDQVDFLVIPSFIVPIGRFEGRVIDLAIPVPGDYPRTVGASIHIKSNPQLLEKSDSLTSVRNIIDSSLGEEWRYWSFRFIPQIENTAENLMHQINGVFKNI